MDENGFTLGQGMQATECEMVMDLKDLNRILAAEIAKGDNYFGETELPAGHIVALYGGLSRPWVSIHVANTTSDSLDRLTAALAKLSPGLLQ